MTKGALDNAYLIFTCISIFFIGFTTGYFINSFINRKTNQEAGARLFILVIVTLAWVISSIADILIIDYQTSPIMHTIMGVIVGFFYKNKNEPKEQKQN